MCPFVNSSPWQEDGPAAPPPPPPPGGSGSSSPAGTETQSAAVAAGPLLIHTRDKHGASVTRGRL